MQTNNRLLDDIARLAGSVTGLASGVRHEAEDLIRARLQALIADMDVVPREEFEAARDMAAKARLEQEKLQERLNALEARLAKLEKPGAKPRPASAKTGAEKK